MSFSQNMGISIIKFLFLIFLLPTLILAASCNKESSKPCRNAVYSFSVTSIFSPEKEIYQIGDTISFLSEFPKNLVNNNYPNATIDYSNSVNIGGDLTLSILDSVIHDVHPAKDSFSFISLKGNFVERSPQPNTGINFLYMEYPTTYLFLGKIICRKKGVYGLGVTDLYAQGIKGKDCTNAGFVMNVMNVNKHFYIYQNVFGFPPEQYTMQRGYVFRVQ